MESVMFANNEPAVNVVTTKLVAPRMRNQSRLGAQATYLTDR